MNIELTKEFVISVVTEDLAEAMNKTSAHYPRNVSEYEKVGLMPVKAGANQFSNLIKKS